MQVTAHADPQTPREARRAAELSLAASLVLAEEASPDGALNRAAQRVAREASALGAAYDDELAAPTEALHHALAHALAIGREVVELLSSRGAQSLEALARAQNILYPIARQLGLAEPPPLALRRPEPLPDGAERRRSPRVSIDLDVSYSSESNFFAGFAQDLGDGGLFVATYALSPIGTKIDLEFRLPDGYVVHTLAEVRWHRAPRDPNSDMSPGMGLRFLDLKEEDLRAIRHFLEARIPLFYDED